MKLNSINNVETSGVEQEDKIESHLFGHLLSFPESYMSPQLFFAQFLQVHVMTAADWMGAALQVCWKDSPILDILF